MAAAGEGKRDAMMGVAGMLVGAGVFVAGYPVLSRLQRAIADWGKATWPSLSATSPWPWVLGLALVALGSYLFTRRRGSAARHSPLGRLKGRGSDAPKAFVGSNMRTRR